MNALGGAATIVNRGTITGALLLTDNADSIANSGTLTLGGGTRLGAGDDLITNNGLVQLAGNVDFGNGNDCFVNKASSSSPRRAPPAALR